VHVDGRTVPNLPAGSYYPFVGKRWTALRGQNVSIGTVYLPLVVPGTLQPVSLTSATTITMAASIVSSIPIMALASIVVPSNSLYYNNGTRGGSVGLAPVPPDRIPGRLPPGLTPAYVITIQTDGATNFDVPPIVCLPITVPIPPEGFSFFSFNHDVGAFEEIGPVEIIDNGTRGCSPV
jgi:hypothetical protein